MPSFNNYIYIDGYYRDIDLTLISVKTDSFDYGPRYPLFEDLLPLEMGDYMLYKYTREDNSPYFPGVEFYYGKYYLSRDVIDEDNFSLTYGRVKYVGGLPIYEGIYSDTINRQTWEQIMYSDDRSMNFNPESEHNPIIEDNYNYVYVQSVSEVHYQGQLSEAIVFSWKIDRHPAHVFLDTTSCQFINIFGSFDHLYSYYSTLTGRYCDHGNSYIDYDSYMPYYDCLIGYSIGDLEWGQQSVPTTITTYLQPVVQVFPNPANDKLYCFAGQLQTAGYTIYANNGQLVASGQWVQGQGLDVQALPPGIYVLQLLVEHDSYRTVFMKQ